MLKKVYDDEGKHYSANVTRLLLCPTLTPQLFFLYSNRSLPNSPLRIIDKKSFRYNFVFLRNQVLYRPIGLNVFPAQKRCLFGRQPCPDSANECCRVQGKRLKDRVGHIRFHNPRMQSHRCDIWILSSDIGLQN